MQNKGYSKGFVQFGHFICWIGQLYIYVTIINGRPIRFHVHNLSFQLVKTIDSNDNNNTEDSFWALWNNFAMEISINSAKHTQLYD